MNDDNILPVILAGGKSRRFGEDKNLAILGNKTLLEHTISKIRKKFKQILIVANQKVVIKKSNSISVISDCIKGNLGPLVGVLSSMRWIKENKMKYNWIATFPSDTPFFDISIIEAYKKKIISSPSLLYFVKSQNKRHNIFGLWSIELLEKLENDIINKNFRKVEEWANKIGVETIDIESKKFDLFLNINTKIDLIKAKNLLEKFEND